MSEAGSRPAALVTGALVVNSLLAQDATNKTSRILPRRVNPALPAALERIILKALRKKRDLRYQHASELRVDFERLQRRAAGRRQYGLIAAAVLLPLVIVIGGLAFSYSRDSSGSSLMR